MNRREIIQSLVAAGAFLSGPVWAFEEQEMTDEATTNGSAGFEIRIALPGTSRDVPFGYGNLDELLKILDLMDTKGVRYDGTDFKPRFWQFKATDNTAFVQIVL